MFELAEITTSDGIIHQGLVAYPKNTGKIALIWIHGLTGTFYGNINLLHLLASESIKKGFAFGSFNNRGHDMLSSARKINSGNPKGYDYITLGSGYEIFEDCLSDIDATIEFFLQKGYENIVLLGHSSGANKVSYYCGNQRNKTVQGAVLLCPMSDRLDPNQDKQVIKENIDKCFSLIESGREDALVTGLHYFPMTAKRYISLVTPNTAEDQFGYGDVPPVMNEYERIQIPLLVILAEKDEHADRTIDDIKKIFDTYQHSSKYKSLVISDSIHNLAGKEKDVIQEIFLWIEKIA